MQHQRRKRLCRRSAMRAALFGMLVTGGAMAGEPRPWEEYHTILWTGDSAYRHPEKIGLFFQRAREMGINTAMVHGDGDATAVHGGQPSYYVENMINRGLCLKWNSPLTDWDKFVSGWAKAGRPESAFLRPYSLDDPAWQGWARGEMARLAGKHAANSPLCYNIRDELSTTISANPFDFDYSPLALEHFRGWLRGRYTDLAALNAEWETQFASWSEVRPFSTDRIKNRMSGGGAIPRGQPDWQALQALHFAPATAAAESTRWNFAPWCDFRTYMDVSLAETLGALRDAARKIDPATPVGIEGTQMPNAFGGYDLWRLSQAVDWVEPYDIGNAREILGSFMPGKPVLTTVFETETGPAKRRLWHLLLEGDRGCLVWWSEDCIDWQSKDYALTAKAKALAPALHEMTSPLARLFLRARPVKDPIFIHYSHASIQVDWLLESTVDGSTWVRRFSSFEAEHNQQAKARNAWVKLLQDAGYSPQFISSEQIEKGELRKTPTAALILSESWAMSEGETAEIKHFLANSPSSGAKHIVLGDGAPGIFDEHGKLRSESALQGSFEVKAPFPAAFALEAGKPAAAKPGKIAEYGLERLNASGQSSWPDWLASHLPLPLPREIQIRPTGDAEGTSARVRIHRYRAGRGHLLAFERNFDYQMSEDLKQAGGNEALEKAMELEAVLPSPGHVYDLRTEKYLGYRDRIPFTLDPWQPTLLAILEEQHPPNGIVEALLKEMK